MGDNDFRYKATARTQDFCLYIFREGERLVVAVVLLRERGRGSVVIEREVRGLTYVLFFPPMCTVLQDRE